MADQTEPVKRRVAVKLIKEGMDSGRVLARAATSLPTGHWRPLPCMV